MNQRLSRAPQGVSCVSMSFPPCSPHAASPLSILAPLSSRRAGGPSLSLCLLSRAMLLVQLEAPARGSRSLTSAAASLDPTSFPGSHVSFRSTNQLLWVKSGETHEGKNVLVPVCRLGASVCKGRGLPSPPPPLVNPVAGETLTYS